MAKDFWDKIQAGSVLIASIFVPLAVAYVGNGYNQSIKESENKIRYIETALSILREEPKLGNDAIRAWAVSILNAHSQANLSPEGQHQLINANKLEVTSYGIGFDDWFNPDKQILSRKGKKEDYFISCGNGDIIPRYKLCPGEYYCDGDARIYVNNAAYKKYCSTYAQSSAPGDAPQAARP